MIGGLLNLFYLLLIATLSPVLVWRSVRQGKYRHGWAEKFFGRLPRSAPHDRVVWLHAVSVGEVLQLRTIVPRLRAARPACDVLITTTTSTGHDVACKTFPDCRVSYFPLDFTWAVREALDRVRPALVVLVELELWPNFIREVHAAGVPLALVNGRMSRKSYRGYRRIRPVMRPLLGRFDRVAVQTEEYAARLRDLGAPSQRLVVTGSVKFDGVRVDRNNPMTQLLRQAFGIADRERVFIAGSTHEPEERIALDAYRSLREEFDDLRLVIVPRHAERFDEVAALVASRGFGLLRRSEQGRSKPNGTPTDRPVCLLDTLGELSACWGLADVAFVGGSLMSRGGQNMIEPAGYGAAVVVGPHTHNFRDVVEGLTSCGAITVIRGPDELEPAVAGLLRDAFTAGKQGQSARSFVLAQQGATDRTVALLTELLPQSTQWHARRDTETGIVRESVGL